MALQCRQNLNNRKAKEMKERSQFLESMALNSESMIAATRTTKLCAHNWDEDVNNYMIQSKLTDKMVLRLRDISKYGVHS